jgi:proton glutamate symport protein
MKIKLALHNQILIALLLGTLFGAFFNIDHHKMIFLDVDNNEFEVKNWEKVQIINPTTDYDVTFKTKYQNKITKSFNRIKLNDRIDSQIIIYFSDDSQKIYDNIKKIKKEETLATHIRPLGTLFINLLSFLAIPLVLASLITGAASLETIKKLGSIGSKTFAIYIATTAVAITIGLIVANVIEPGNRIPEADKIQMMGEFEDDAADVSEELEVDIIDFFLNIVPKNPFNAISKGNMIQIVFIAVFFGITLTLIDKKKSEPVLNFFNGISEAMIKMVEIVMLIAPYGVFALIAATIADFGFNILSTLLWYILSVIIGLLLQTVLVYAGIVKFVGREKISVFFKGIRNAQAIAFSTSSSAATLPVTLDCVENNLKVKKEISGFVLPLGATINMDGTALYQGVAAVFIAQIYGMDLSIAEQLTVVITAVLASIGTAPVPGVGIIMLVIILQSVNIPPQGIALILGVDRILDMLRTVTNVSGDSAVAVAINRLTNRK